jgi:hypothetical protein
MTSKDTETEYAFWNSPDQPFRITYSLDQFHQIDFEVSEGYRRIPHGGIEVGGLLFGMVEPSGVRIQAFRLIECEHATGPSFILSERDLERLQEQMNRSASDGDLVGLEILGWFIAHTRTALRLSDREVDLFNRFFPKRHQLTVLVKPERFQPTRFAFLARNDNGSVDRDGTNTAIILPLPARSNRATAESPMPSIAAPPAEKPVAPAPFHRESRSTNRYPVPAEPEHDETVPAESTRVEIPPPPGDATPPQTAVAPEVPSRPTGVWPPIDDAARDASAARPEPLDSEEIKSLATVPKKPRLPSVSEIQSRRPDPSPSEKEAAAPDRTTFSVGLALLLLLAAVLGCGAGYWAYEQLPAPVVPLSVHPEAAALVVTWPTEQTRKASYAAIRVNDGAQQPLSNDEKRAGAARITVPALSNAKVELIVQHWMRDSRGIVRYVNAMPPPSTQPDQQVSH